MADQNLYEVVKEFFANIFGNPAVAAQVAADPQAALDAYGITDYDDAVYRQAAYDASQDYDLPYGDKDALYNYSQGGSAPANYQVPAPGYTSGGQPAAQYHATGAEAVHHVQYVTYAAYEQNPEIRNEVVNNFQVVTVDQSTNVDNSLNLDGNFNVDGAFNLTNSNVTATGDEAIAFQGDGNQLDIGDGDRIEVSDVDGTVLLNSEVGGNVQNATGGGAITDVSGDDNIVGSEIGERAVVGNEFGDNALVGNEFGDNALVGSEVGAGALVNSRVEGQVNTGEFTGVQAGGEVRNATVGDDNQVANQEFDLTVGGDGGEASSGSSGDGVNGDTSGTAEGTATSGNATGGTGGDGSIGNIGNVNFGGGGQNNLSENEFDLFDGSALSLDGEASGTQDSFNTEDSFKETLDQQINQEILVEDSQLTDVGLTQDAPGTAEPADQADDSTDVPVA